MSLRFVILVVAIGLAVAGSVSADENVRAVQEQLRDGGFYSGEIDGAYSSELAEALTRYQTRNNLPVTGQLDVDTSNALDAKPAVTKSRAAAEQSSETSRQSRRREQQTLRNAPERSSPRSIRSDSEAGPTSSGPVAPRVTSEPATQSTDSPSLGAEETETSTQMQPRSASPATGSEGTRPVSAPPAAGRISSETTELASAPPATVSRSSDDGVISTERLRDYVGAFVHAGTDPQVGSEADFFADRVKYYDQGVIGREQIRNDLRDYAARWPERHFWFVGNITIEPQHRKRVRVTFPLRYELRNGAAYSSGTINKTLVLEQAGNDLQIVAVSEGKADL